jgi:hypothetical protein
MFEVVVENINFDGFNTYFLPPSAARLLGWRTLATLTGGQPLTAQSSLSAVDSVFEHAQRCVLWGLPPETFGPEDYDLRCFGYVVLWPDSSGAVVLMAQDPEMPG